MGFRVEVRVEVTFTCTRYSYTPMDLRHVHAHPWINSCISGTDDDEFILNYAITKDAKVLSNDLYRDHIERRVVSRSWVDEHRWSFMFVGQEFVVPSAMV